MTRANGPGLPLAFQRRRWTLDARVTAKGFPADLRGLYEKQGYVGPLTAFPPEELERLGVIALISSFEATPDWARNRHLDSPLIARICQNETVLSCVRALLGPNLILWRSNIFAIASAGRGLGWHQDTYRTLLDSPPGAAQCSVQINFSDSTSLNAVSVIPGSHAWTDEVLQERGFHVRRTGDRGLYGTPYWDIPVRTATKKIFMTAGQFYVFHPRLLHASVRARWIRGARNEQSLGPRLLQRTMLAYETWRRKDPVRYSLTLRVATPETRVLPLAFQESPKRAGVVVLSGADTASINRLSRWATEEQCSADRSSS